MRRQSIIVANIHIGSRWRRTVSDKVVEGLASSIASLGLRSPISVVFRDGVEVDGDIEDGVPVLVAGRHRLEALRRLGWQTVECDVFDDPISAEKWEISENIHRADLTLLERDEQVDRWIFLTENQLAEAAKDERVFSQDAKKLSERGRAGEGRPEGGVNAAARELGIPKDAAYRATQVAALPEAAKAEVRAAGLDNNRSAMLSASRAAKAAKKAGGDESAAAVARVQEIVARKSAPKPAPTPTPISTPAPTHVPVIDAIHSAEDDWVAKMKKEYLSAPVDWRERFIFEIQSGALFGALS